MHEFLFPRIHGLDHDLSKKIYMGIYIIMIVFFELQKRTVIKTQTPEQLPYITI